MAKAKKGQWSCYLGAIEVLIEMGKIRIRCKTKLVLCICSVCSFSLDDYRTFCDYFIRAAMHRHLCISPSMPWPGGSYNFHFQRSAAVLQSSHTHGFFDIYRTTKRVSMVTFSSFSSCFFFWCCFRFPFANRFANIYLMHFDFVPLLLLLFLSLALSLPLFNIACNFNREKQKLMEYNV